MEPTTLLDPDVLSGLMRKATDGTHPGSLLKADCDPPRGCIEPHSTIGAPIDAWITSIIEILRRLSEDPEQSRDHGIEAITNKGSMPPSFTVIGRV